MLNLHRLAPGAESYYLDQVVSGLEDYYAEHGEAPGYWLASSDQLSLDGPVRADDLRSVLTGLDPSTGEQLHRAKNRKVPGWDLTFRAPKSVSILWGLGDADIARQVVAAHEAAVARAVSYMEEVAAWTRTGHNGIHREKANGFVAAGFRHRMSRDRDPLLHTHVLVANSLRTDDGRWRTIDAVAMYDHAKTGGYIYQAQLRHELTTRLGVEWTPIHDGLADIAGIEQDLIDLFSKRREQIETTMAEWGLTSAKAAQVSTLETRRAKTVRSEPVSEQLDRWRAEALTVGLDSSDLRLVTGQLAVPTVDTSASNTLFDQLSSPAGLTADRSTFDRRDALRSVIDQAPAGVPVETVERLTDAYLRRPEVVMIGWNERTGTTFSTTELVELEQSVLDLAEEGLAAGVGLAVETAVESAVETPSISDEQSAVVTEMCTSGRGVEVLVAAAGTGKTFSLDAAREAWQRSRYTVIGCALSASAAHELQGGSGIRSTTIAMLNLDIHQDRRRLDDRTVLVIDEAGMVGTRTLAPLLQHAADAGTKVVLVGDPKQLPEIQAGGVLASLAGRHPVLTLTENRRQHDQIERDALEQLRSGDVDRAIGMLRDHGRVLTGANAETVRDGMVEQWWRHRTTGGEEALMMARRNADVDDLNRRARRHVAAAGELSGEPLVVNECPFQVGDQVICTRNDYANGIRNGTTGTITHIDHRRTAITLSTEDGTRRLDDEYLAAGSMRHGYAVTVHKAQGRTCEHGLLLASGDLHREMGYVGLSRGKQSNRMYLVSDESVDELEHHSRPGERADPLDLAVDSLRRRGAKGLAIDQADRQSGLDDGVEIGW